MAKALTHTTDGARQNTASWFLLVVSVACLTVLAISVPHLITAGGWFTGAAAGQKFLYVALIAYLGASVLYGSSIAFRQTELSAGAVLAGSRRAASSHPGHWRALGEFGARPTFRHL